MGFCTKTDPEIRGILGRRAFPNPRQGCALRGGTFSPGERKYPKRTLKGVADCGDGHPLKNPPFAGEPDRGVSGYPSGAERIRTRLPLFPLPLLGAVIGKWTGSTFAAPGCVGVLAGRLSGAFPGRGGRFGKKRKQTGGLPVCFGVFFNSGRDYRRPPPRPPPKEPPPGRPPPKERPPPKLPPGRPPPKEDRPPPKLPPKLPPGRALGRGAEGRPPPKEPPGLPPGEGLPPPKEPPKGPPGRAPGPGLGPGRADGPGPKPIPGPKPGPRGGRGGLGGRGRKIKKGR